MKCRQIVALTKYFCALSRKYKIGDYIYIYIYMYMYVYLYVYTVYPGRYARGFVVLCFVVVMQSFIMNSHEVFILIHQGCVAGIGAIVRLPQCRWSRPDGYGKISQCMTTAGHGGAEAVCVFLGIYCVYIWDHSGWRLDQWEAALYWNVVFRGLGPYPEWSLKIYVNFKQAHNNS